MMPSQHTGRFFFKHTMALIVLPWVCVNAAANSVLHLDNISTYYALSEYIQYLEDPSGNLTISDITSASSASRFTPSLGTTPGFGFTHSVYWVRFTLHNPYTFTQDWIVVQNFANTHFLDLYIPQTDGRGFSVKKSGNLRPYSTRDIADRRIAFSLSIPAEHQATYYVRYQTQTAMTIDLSLWRQSAFYAAANRDNLMYGIFYGVLGIMLFYNAFIFAFLREKAYLWLVAFIASLLLASLFYHGQAQTLFSDTTIGLSIYAVPTAVAFMSITILKFTEAYLPALPDNSLLQRFNNVLLTLLILSVAAIPFLSYKLLAQIFAPINMITILFCAARGGYAFYRKQTEAYWYALAWSMALLGLFLVMAARYNLVPLNTVTEYSYLFGFTWMVLFMSVALANRVNMLRSRVHATTVELEQSEHNYQTLFNSAADGFVIRTLDGRAVDVNPAITAMYGYSREEYLNLPVEKIAHPDSLHLYRRFKENMALGRPFFTDEAKAFRKDGKLFYLQVQANVIQYQGKPHAFIVLRDISKQKRVQHAIQNVAAGVSNSTGERFFQQLAVYLGQVMHAEHVIIGVLNEENHHRMNTLALYNRGALGDNRDIDLAASPCLELTQQQICVFPDEVQVHYPHDQLIGEFNAVSYCAAALQDSNKVTLGYLIVIDTKSRPDIGEMNEVLQLFAARAAAEIERLKAEDLINRHQQYLEKTVAERTAKLTALNQELEAFSYSVSHDLRAPLRSMDGFSQALLEDYTDKLDENGRDYLHRIRGSAQKMSRLIDDLLLLSRVSRKDIVKRKVNLSGLINNSIHKCREQSGARQVKISVTQDLTTHGDADLLAIAMDNLVSNAWKYTRKTPHPEIEFGVTRKNGKQCYFIKDNGAGFDMRYVEKLFQAFQRLHQPDEFEGTGIGLATVARIIRRHGGEIWAEAEEGRGAVFYFSLHAEEHLSKNEMALGAIKA